MVISVLTADEMADDANLASAGRVTPHCDVRIMDANGRVLGPNEPGEIVARGPLMMNGYHKMPEETSKTIIDGWLHTGDVGYLDERGFLFIKDRMRDVIISGGFNVFTIEVEDALVQHPSVRECVAFGVPDGKWGERVEAALELTDGAEACEDQIIAFTRHLIGGVKAPKTHTFFPGSAPQPCRQGDPRRSQGHGHAAAGSCGMTQAHIAGISMLKTGRWLERSVRDMAEEVCRDALSEAGVAADVIEAVWFSNTRQALMEGQNSIRGQAALRGLGLNSASITNVENACASSSTGLWNAANAIGSGACDIALVVASEKMVYPHVDKKTVFRTFLGGTDIHRIDEARALFRRLSGDSDQSATSDSGAHSFFMDMYSALARQHMRRFGTDGNGKLQPPPPKIMATRP